MVSFVSSKQAATYWNLGFEDVILYNKVGAIDIHINWLLSSLRWEFHALDQTPQFCSTFS